MPEFNPFKYNSFPVNGGRQSYLLTNTLQQQITRLAREKRLDRLAPLLTFQSVIDFTVSTRAVVSALYDLLPPNGSELVLFDVNRSAKFGQLFAPPRTPLWHAFYQHRLGHSEQRLSPMQTPTAAKC